ncbi:hypothetical protein PSTG_04322 [Puccinia striiformis f. sp. tritici PST-78]|nr:hypothetical protein PSTG_04322 [Puccinia striiformis f. sp. tritici PST-78]
MEHRSELPIGLHESENQSATWICWPSLTHPFWGSLRNKLTSNHGANARIRNHHMKEERAGWPLSFSPPDYHCRYIVNREPGSVLPRALLHSARGWKLDLTQRILLTRPRGRLKVSHSPNLQPTGDGAHGNWVIAKPLESEWSSGYSKQNIFEMAGMTSRVNGYKSRSLQCL